MTVSVVVITYNSSKFIFETLDSIKEQSYKNLELIISDDASTDDTVEICRRWTSKNIGRFVRTEILTINKNTGIPANYNRGIISTTGKWIKPVAGDDALMPNCIKDNMEYVLIHPDVKVLYSYNKVYKEEFKKDKYLKMIPSSFPSNIITNEISAHEQYNILLKGNCIPFTPSLFLNRDALLDSGLPDEDLFSEDYQMTLKLTRKGYKLNFMEKETVLYRQHEEATHNTIEKFIIKPHYFKTEKFRERYIYPNIPKDISLNHKYCWIVNQIFKFDLMNRKNKFNEIIHYLLNVLLNPFKYIIYIKSHFLKKYKNNIFYS